MHEDLVEDLEEEYDSAVATEEEVELEDGTETFWCSDQ